MNNSTTATTNWSATFPFIPMNIYVYIAETIGFVLAIPSLLLYLLECAIIIWWWRKSFNNSFYRIFLFTAFNNIFLNFLCYTVPDIRFLDMGLFVDFYNKTLPAEWAPKMLYSLSFFTYHTENFLTVIIIAHRLSAILWPMDFEQIWRYFLPISMSITLVGSIAFTIPVLTLNIKFFPDYRVPQMHRLILGYFYEPKKQQFNCYQFVMILTVIFFLLSTAMNVAIIWAYRRHKSRRAQQRDANERKNDVLEHRLLVYTVAMFAAQIFHSAFWIFAYFFTLYPVILRPYNNLISAHYVWINDLRVLVFPAWFLYWASSEVSKHLKEILTNAVASIGQTVGKGMARLGVKKMAQKNKKKRGGGGGGRRGGQLSMVRRTMTEEQRRRRATLPAIVSVSG